MSNPIHGIPLGTATLRSESSFPSIAIENSMGNPDVHPILESSATGRSNNNNNNNHLSMFTQSRQNNLLGANSSASGQFQPRSNNNNNNTAASLLVPIDNHLLQTQSSASLLSAGYNQNTFPRTASNMSAYREGLLDDDDETRTHPNQQHQPKIVFGSNQLHEDDMQTALSRHTSALLGAMGMANRDKNYNQQQQQQSPQIQVSNASASSASNSGKNKHLTISLNANDTEGNVIERDTSNVSSEAINHNNNKDLTTSASNTPKSKNINAGFSSANKGSPTNNNPSPGGNKDGVRRTQSGINVVFEYNAAASDGGGDGEEESGDEGDDGTSNFGGDSSKRTKSRSGKSRRGTGASSVGGPGSDPANDLMSSMMLEQDRFEAMRRREKVYRVLIDGDDGGFHMKQVFKRVWDASRTRDRYSTFAKTNATANPPPPNLSSFGGSQLTDPVIIATALHQLRPHLNSHHQNTAAASAPHSLNIRWTKTSKLAFNKNTGLMHFSEFHMQTPIPSWREFATDLESLLLTTENGMCAKACSQRLEIMQERSKMITLLNRELEAPQQPAREGGVFAEVTKVDNSLRFFRCWNAQDGLECIVDQLTDRVANSDIVGQDATGRNVTIGEVFARFGVENPAGLTPDRLGWQGRPVSRQPAGATEPVFNPLLPVARPLTMLLHQLDSKLFQRVLKRRVRSIEYSYLGDAGLDGSGDRGGDRGGGGGSDGGSSGQGNNMGGNAGGPGSGGGAGSKNAVGGGGGKGTSFQTNSQAAEIRIPFYGIIPDEMARIARTMKVNEFGNNQRIAWFLELNLFDYPICMPAAYGSTGLLEPANPARGTNRSRRDTFLQFLECLFLPLVSATLAPEERANSSLGWFLEQVGGFVFTSREGRARPPIHSNFVHPSQVHLGGDNVSKFNEAYFEYFIWGNLQILNVLRSRRGLNTFQYRRGTSGGDVSSLISGYLLADVVTNVGSIIHRYPVLQYLLGMNVVPITVSPIYDNAHGLPMHLHPLPALLHRCLSISLASEEPLHTHRDTYSINEEYATAQKCFRLSALDVTQMMRNSVLTSCFSDDAKKAWFGDGWESGPGARTQVSMFRFEFRKDVWVHEKNILGDLFAQNLGMGLDNPVSAAQMGGFFQGGHLNNNNNNGSPLSPGHHNHNNNNNGDKINNKFEADGTNNNNNNNNNSNQVGNSNNNLNVTHNNNNVASSGNNNNNNHHQHQQQNNSNNNNNNSNTTDPSKNLANNNANPASSLNPSNVANDANSANPSASSPSQPSTVLTSRQFAAAQAQLSRVTDIEYFAVTDKRVNFPRTVIVGPGYTSDTIAKNAAELIQRATVMRHRYIWRPPLPWERRNITAEEAFRKKTATFDEEEWHYVSKDSIFVAYRKKDVHSWPKHLPTLDAFHQDYYELKAITDNEDLKKLAFDRLDMLEHKFRLHLATNHAIESGASETGGMGNRDFYHCTKVDTHIHMAAGMTARTMLNFILEKVARNADDVVDKDKSGHVMTLGAFAQKHKITENLTVDQMNVLADHTLFERFDNFNNHYNPMGLSELRGLLLKTDNFMNGRYFAEVIQRTFDEYSKDKYTFAENRLSIYGNSESEWNLLAEWFDTFGMSSKHNKWMIQLPRLYTMSRAAQRVTSFGQYIENIFKPLWEASLHPSKHARLHCFLNHVSGFDSVDNEARIDQPFSPVPPWQWTREENPPYPYYCYHLYANIRTLNEFRSMRGLSTFSFRPHSGESGATEHLVACFLTADLINHGINLKNNTALQYLYYLAQIGLDVSPLSNNALFLYFLQNPFPKFFRCGLNVALSTDDPLMFHQTKEPLIEEYSIAAKVWDFSPNDMCEIARNSCLHSGFTHSWKMQKLGSRYYLSSSLGNDPNLTHLSDVRVAYRFETYHAEVAYVERFLHSSASPSAAAGHHQQLIPRCMYTSEQENKVIERETFASEPVLFSTLDQEMEVLQRDMEGKRESIRSIKAHLTTLRTKNRALIDSLTEVGLKNNLEEKRQQEELDRLAVLKERQRKLDFLRSMGSNALSIGPPAIRDGNNNSNASSNNMTATSITRNVSQANKLRLGSSPITNTISMYHQQQQQQNPNHISVPTRGGVLALLNPSQQQRDEEADQQHRSDLIKAIQDADQATISILSNNNQNNKKESGDNNNNTDAPSIINRAGSLRVSDILQMQQKTRDQQLFGGDAPVGGQHFSQQQNNNNESDQNQNQDLALFTLLLEQEQQQEELQNRQHQQRRLMLMSPRMPPKPKPPMHDLHVGRPVPNASNIQFQSQNNNNNNNNASRNLFVSSQQQQQQHFGGTSYLVHSSSASPAMPPTLPKRKDHLNGEEDDEQTKDNNNNNGAAPGTTEDEIRNHLLNGAKNRVGGSKRPNTAQIQPTNNNNNNGGLDKERSKNISSSLGMLKYLAKGTGTVPELKVTGSLFDG